MDVEEKGRCGELGGVMREKTRVGIYCMSEKSTFSNYSTKEKSVISKIISMKMFRFIF